MGASSDLKELRELSALQRFNLFEFLRTLNDLGSVYAPADVDIGSTIGTRGGVVDDELGDGLKALLAALRAQQADTHKVESCAGEGGTIASFKNMDVGLV